MPQEKAFLGGWELRGPEDAVKTLRRGSPLGGLIVLYIWRVKQGVGKGHQVTTFQPVKIIAWENPQGLGASAESGRGLCSVK
jgi:hypothetical protein